MLFISLFFRDICLKMLHKRGITLMFFFRLKGFKNAHELFALKSCCKETISIYYHLRMFYSISGDDNLDNQPPPHHHHLHQHHCPPTLLPTIMVIGYKLLQRTILWCGACPWRRGGAPTGRLWPTGGYLLTNKWSLYVLTKRWPFVLPIGYHFNFWPEVYHIQFWPNGGDSPHQ